MKWDGMAAWSIGVGWGYDRTTGVGQGNCIDGVGRCGMTTIYMAQVSIVSNCDYECRVRGAGEGT